MTEFSEVRGFLGALACFVPQRTYTALTREYDAFVTWPAGKARKRRVQVRNGSQRPSNSKDHSFEGGSTPQHSPQWPQLQMRGGQQSPATPLGKKGQNSEDY